MSCLKVCIVFVCGQYLTSIGRNVLTCYTIRFTKRYWAQCGHRIQSLNTLNEVCGDSRREHGRLVVLLRSRFFFHLIHIESACRLNACIDSCVRPHTRGGSSLQSLSFSALVAQTAMILLIAIVPDRVEIYVTDESKHTMPVPKTCAWQHPQGLARHEIGCISADGGVAESFFDIWLCMKQAACEITGASHYKTYGRFQDLCKQRGVQHGNVVLIYKISSRDVKSAIWRNLIVVVSS